MKTAIITRNTYVVENILPSNMQHSIGKICIGHLESIIRGPEGRPIRVTHPCEPAARSRVGLEHDERFASLLHEIARVDVRGDEIGHTRFMFEVKRKDGLWGSDGCTSVKLGTAIVVWVAKEKLGIS